MVFKLCYINAEGRKSNGRGLKYSQRYTGGDIRLLVDINISGAEDIFTEKTMWFSVKNENADMLTDETYDAFFLVPLYLAMYFHQDLHIHGKVSKCLYKNAKWYLEKIFCDFSDDLQPVDIIVDGFASIDEPGHIVGTGISCGIDSLSTIYDHYVKEQDPEYKINALFLFNCGTHGDYENPNTHKLFLSRLKQNKAAADDLHLPIYAIDSNLHAFTHKIGETKMGFIAIHSCILSMQKAISKYYISSSGFYRGIHLYADHYHDLDMAGFCESYCFPLIYTEHTKLILDGCQYTRSQKTSNIADWDIAQKHLNVCVNSIDGENCSYCHKCVRTILPLKAMGMLDKFSNVFDIDAFNKKGKREVYRVVLNRNKDLYALDNLNFAKEHHMPMPSLFEAYIHLFPSIIFQSMKKVSRSILGKDKYLALKHMLKK